MEIGEEAIMGSKKNTYSVDENLKLVELVGKYQADVLNVQKTGPFVNRHKNAAWEKIAEEFNQTSEMRVSNLIFLSNKKSCDCEILMFLFFSLADCTVVTDET